MTTTPVDLGSKHLEAEIDNGTLRVRIDRPERKNSMTTQMYYGVKKACRVAEDEPEIDMEACAPLEQLPAELPGLQIRELPAVENMASTIHHGSFNGLATAYAELVKWIELNGYLVDGPDREIYLRLPDFGKSGDESAITEMQVPVRKAN